MLFLVRRVEGSLRLRERMRKIFLTAHGEASRLLLSPRNLAYA